MDDKPLRRQRRPETTPTTRKAEGDRIAQQLGITAEAARQLRARRFPRQGR